MSGDGGGGQTDADWEAHNARPEPDFDPCPLCGGEVRGARMSDDDNASGTRPSWQQVEPCHKCGKTPEILGTDLWWRLRCKCGDWDAPLGGSFADWNRKVCAGLRAENARLRVALERAQDDRRWLEARL